MSKIVYVAGRYRGPTPWEIHQNIERAKAIALACWGMGLVVICPHLNTPLEFQDSYNDAVWLNGDLEIIRKVDGMVLVPNWMASIGARREMDLARTIDIPIFSWDDELHDAIGPRAKLLSMWAQDDSDRRTAS